MARWLWVALAIGCSGDDKDAGDDAAGETDSTNDVTVDDPLGTKPDAACADVPLTDPVASLHEVTQIDHEGHPAYYGLPEGTPRAVVIYFHGSGGSANDVLGTEQTAVLNQLAPFGWAFVASESEDQTPNHQWNTSHDPDNPDMTRVRRVLDQVVADTPIEPETPIVLMGFSNGGSALAAFADIYGRELTFAAAAFHNTGGGDVAMPSIWLSTTNDGSFAPASMAAKAEAQEADGYEAEHIDQDEVPVSVELLQRHPLLDEEEATALFDEMVAIGLVAEDGTRLAEGNGDELDKILSAWGRNSELTGASRASDLMHAIWALHKFNGFQAKAECEFLTRVVE